MRKYFAALAAAVLAIAGAQTTIAQTFPNQNFYAVKFICGTLAPSNLFPPEESDAKPGNYATQINLLFISTCGGEACIDNGPIYISGEEPSGKVFGAQLFFAGLIDNIAKKINCTDIMDPFVKSGYKPPFVTGYLIFNYEKPVNITAIYTSQACTSFGSPGSNSTTPGSVVIPPTRPVCSGPVSIEVVPQGRAVADVGTVTGGQ
jgi:hypothetical protein